MKNVYFKFLVVFFINIIITSYIGSLEAKESMFVQLGHSHIIDSVTFSYDGKFILTGSNDQKVKLWEASTGKEIRTFRGHRGDVNAVSFAPDGVLGASGDDSGEIKLWNLSTGAQVKSYTFEKKRILSMAFSPVHKNILAFGGNDGMVRILNIKKGSLISNLKFPMNGKYIDSLSFSGNGNLLLAVARKSRSDYSNQAVAAIWSMKSKKVTHTFNELSNHVEKSSVTFSPDNKSIIIAVGKTGDNLGIVDINTKRIIRTFSPKKGFTRPISTVAISPSGDFVAAGSYDGQVAVWHAGSTKQLSSFNHCLIRSLMFSPDGSNLLSGGNDDKPLLWNVVNNEKVRYYAGVKGISKKHSVSFSKDGRYIYGGNNGDVWDLKLATKKGDLGGTTWKGSPYSDDGKLAVTIGSELKLINTDTMEVVRKIGEKQTKKLLGKCRFLWSVSLSNSGKYVLLSCGNGNVQLLDIKNGTKMHSLEGLPENQMGDVFHMTFSPDDRYILTGDRGGRIRVWDVRTGRQKSSRIKDHMAGYVGDITSNNRFVVVGGFYTNMAVWDIDVGKKLFTFPDKSYGALAVKITNDEKAVLSGHESGDLFLWDIETGKLIRKFGGHDGRVNAIDFSDDGKRVVTASHDTTIRLWDVRSGSELAQFISIGKNEWVIMTPYGFFNSSKSGAKNISISNGYNVYNTDQFFNDLYRPDLVQANIANDPDDMVLHASERLNINSLITQGPPPLVSFISPKSDTSKKRDVEVVISLEDRGGGYGKVEWRLNGQVVGVEEIHGRGVKIVQKSSSKSPSISLDRLLTLSPGKNTITVIAFNNSGGIASDPADLAITLRDAISAKPALHILSVGINRYRDKSLWLKYAVADGKALANNLKKAGKDVFTGVHVAELYDQDASFPRIEQAFASVSDKVESQDVFVLFLAGHGITLDGRYYFLPVDFRYRNEDSIRSKAVNQAHIQKWLSGIRARKSLVLMDTCNSGSFVQAQAVTRGLAEKTAIDKLTRATGRATIAASMDTQVALEGYDGHGVFTWALLEALKKADKTYGNKDGVVTTNEIASHIDERVPEITYNKWGYEQVPQSNLHGRQFPIGVSP